jgi:hypothetical protein
MTGTPTMQVGQFGRPILSKDGRTITVRIPITLRHQGGRKQVVTPAGAASWVPARTRVDSTLVKAIVRAHRWRDMLESDDYATVRDLAKAEAINESYLGRVLRLTLLAPTLIEAILEGRQPANLELDDLLQQFPIDWDRQLGSLTAALNANVLG